MLEVMKQAMEALEVEQTVYLRTKLPTPVYLTKAITSLRQAIAEAEKQDGVCQHCAGKGCVACDAREQEPVAWLVEDVDGLHLYWTYKQPIGKEKWTPLFSTPPQRTWVGLTGEMLLKAAQSSLAPEQYDHFEALSKHQPDIYDRLAYAIRVQDE